MQDCETFIRGTLRFKGFSYIINAFHDIGLTSETAVPVGITNLKQLVESVMIDIDESKAPKELQAACDKVLVGASPAQMSFARRFMSKINLSHIPEHEM